MKVSIIFCAAALATAKAGKVVIEGNNTAGRNLIGASGAGGDHDVNINGSNSVGRDLIGISDSILPNDLIPQYTDVSSPGSKHSDTTTASPKEEAKSDLKTYEIWGIVSIAIVTIIGLTLAIVAIIGLTLECRRRRGHNRNGVPAAGQVVNPQANVNSSHTTTETPL